MKIVTVSIGGRVYVDSLDLLNAFEAWKPKLDTKEVAVLTAVSKNIEKCLNSIEP